MTGIQALERNAKRFRCSPVSRRIEFEYTRHGTLCLIGNWHVVLGQMIAPTIRPTRTEEDFCWHIITPCDRSEGGLGVRGRQFEHAL